MNLSNRPRNMRTLLRVWTGAVATVLPLGIGAWIAVRPKAAQVEPPPRAAAPLQPSKHLTGKVHFDVLAKLLADDHRSDSVNDWMQGLADPRATFRVETQVHPLLHRAAPDFTLESHQGQRWRLHQQLERGPVVVVFYLGFACNACVRDLFELNADIKRFNCLGAEIVGVSGDAPAFTQLQFERYGNVSFPVLSDPGHAVAHRYGTFRAANVSQAQELRHGTFIVGRDGRVDWVNCGDAPFLNNKALLFELARLENKLPQFSLAFSAGQKEAKVP